DDLRAGLHLLARHAEGRPVLAVLDQLAEFGRAGDVGPLADVDEDLGLHSALLTVSSRKARSACPGPINAGASGHPDPRRRAQIPVAGVPGSRTAALRLPG